MRIDRQHTNFNEILVSISKIRLCYKNEGLPQFLYGPFFVSGPYENFKGAKTLGPIMGKIVSYLTKYLSSIDIFFEIKRVFLRFCFLEAYHLVMLSSLSHLTFRDKSTQKPFIFQ